MKNDFFLFGSGSIPTIPKTYNMPAVAKSCSVGGGYGIPLFWLNLSRVREFGYGYGNSGYGYGNSGYGYGNSGTGTGILVTSTGILGTGTGILVTRREFWVRVREFCVRVHGIF